jgi:hypothetical protein
MRQHDWLTYDIFLGYAKTFAAQRIYTLDD